jgi:ABC-type multidrug transport system fused ATPase/permease subunit
MAEQDKSAGNKVSSFKILLHYLKPYKLWVLIRIASTCVKAVVDVYIANLVMMLINDVLYDEGKDSHKILLVIILSIILDLLAFYYESYSSTIFSAKVAYDMKNKFSSHIVNLPISYIDNQKSGDIVSKLVNNIGAVEAYLRGGFLDFIFHSLRFSVCFVVMAILNWKLLLICLAIMSIAMILSNYITKPLSAYNEKLYGVFGKVLSVIQDSINGISVMKAYNLEKTIRNKYEEANEEALAAALKIDRQNYKILPVRISLNLVPVILCYVIGGYMVVKNIFSVGGLAAFSVMLNYLVEAITQIPGYIGGYRANTGILQNLNMLLQVDQERFGSERCEVKEEMPAFEFKDVAFSYHEAPVLDGLNLTIPAGKKVALVGPSGCGKSTIMKLMCGFYTIDQGELKIYGRNIYELDIESLRSQITIVTQETFLFPGTIAENIAYGREGATMEEIQAAAKSAYAHDFIMNMPDQYNTIVGERGVRLSGGEKQRISIARAILKDTPVLLMDEPTSSLDTEAELIVQKAINELMKNRTVVIIAHRLSTIKDVDQIFVLNENRIVESGTHEELISLNGLYGRLYSEQRVSYNPDENEVPEYAESLS